MGFQIELFFLLAAVVTAISAQVNCDHKREIVNRHNQYRQAVASGRLTGQPKASNMEKIVWDDRLAAVAQKWADKRSFSHNPNRKDSRFPVGENLYTSWSTSSSRTIDWSRAIESWFDEYKLYRYGPFKNDPKIGHYTQIVWADTIYVGCGHSFYKKNNRYTNLYVCNYGSAGNVLGSFPYKKGRGCKNLCCNKNQCRRLYGDKC